MLFLWIPLVLVVFCLLYYLDYQVRQSYKEIPGPPTLPFVGNAHFCIGTSGEGFFNVIHNCCIELGSRVRILIAHRLILLLSDPKDIEVVLTSQEFNNKSKEYEFLHPWLGTGLLTSKGEKWRSHRKIITPAFHFKILENFVQVFEKHSNILIDKLSKKYSSGESIDIYPIMGLYALDVVAEAAMGVAINAQENVDSEYVTAVKSLSEVMQERMINPFKRPDFLFKLTKDYTKLNKALSVLHGYTNKMIRDRRRFLQARQETLSTYTTESEDIYGSKKKMAFLDLLLLSNIDGKIMNDTHIREEVDTFLFEGHDTTSSAISFTLYLISQNPDAQQKLYDEQVDIFGDDLFRDTTYSDFQCMKYMELVIKESLRLFPSVPLLGREVMHDSKINDINVKAKTCIVVMVYTLNHNPEIFPEPDKFIPERFSVEESSKRSPFSNVSFSAGSRNCIGQKFAMYEMKSALSKIVKRFHLLPAEEKLELRCDLVLKSNNGIFIKLKPRNGGL